MAGKKTRREKPLKKPSHKPTLLTPEMAADMLATALGKGEDFIVTFERTDDGKRQMHLLTGNLITPCMLGTLSNRCELPGFENCCHRILKQE